MGLKTKSSTLSSNFIPNVCNFVWVYRMKSNWMLQKSKQVKVHWTLLQGIVYLQLELLKSSLLMGGLRTEPLLSPPPLPPCLKSLFQAGMLAQENFHYPCAGCLIPGTYPAASKTDKCGRIAACDLMLLFYKVFHLMKDEAFTTLLQSAECELPTNVRSYRTIDSFIQVRTARLGAHLVNIPVFVMNLKESVLTGLNEELFRKQVFQESCPTKLTLLGYIAILKSSPVRVCVLRQIRCCRDLLKAKFTSGCQIFIWSLSGSKIRSKAPKSMACSSGVLPVVGMFAKAWDHFPVSQILNGCPM